MKYFKLWLLLSTYTAQTALLTRFGALIFVVSKFLRFFIFLIFIAVIGTRVSAIGGYTIWDMVLFFMTFSFIDTAAQLLFREVYRFRWYIIEGRFDYVLVNPVSPLFRSLLGGADILDIPLLIFAFVGIGIAGVHISTPSFFDVVFYIVLLINGLLIATSFHIFVLGMGITTTAVDNTIMLYRDLTQMVRVPVSLYQEPLRSILTFAIPIGIMISYPAQALIGLLSLQFVWIAFGISGIMFFGSLLFWHFSLKHYSSASS